MSVLVRGLRIEVPWLGGLFAICKPELYMCVECQQISLQQHHLQHMFAASKVPSPSVLFNQLMS